MRWYTRSKKDDRQGLVCCEGDGRNVAVTYDAKDAKMIAECPRMFDELEMALTTLDVVWQERDTKNIAAKCCATRIRQLIYESREEA